MGRNSGGVRGSVSNSRSKGNIQSGKTEKNYTDKMIKNIVGIEQVYRKNKDETLHVFDDKGNIIVSFGGKGAQVKFEANKVPKDSILTHNHPRGIGKTGLASIGNSFSEQDILSAITTNAKEMRAVTPLYTFSLKRPKGGWGVDKKTFSKEWSKAHRETLRDFNNYISGSSNKKQAYERANALHFHRVMQRVSKKFGWYYSKKKG